MLTSADLKTTDADQQSLAKLANSKAWKFAMVRDWGPVGALLLGLFLLVAGIFLPFFDRDRPRRVRSLGAIPLPVEKAYGKDVARSLSKSGDRPRQRARR